MPPRSKPSTITVEAPQNALTRNPQLEELLRSRDFNFEFRSLSLSDIDEIKSRHNQARVGKPIDEDTIERYVANLTNGDIFPAICTYEPRPGAKQEIIDGNHREESHRRFGSTHIDSYVILPPVDRKAITWLTFELNTKHGLPTSEADRIHQALYLMEGGVSAEDAAKRLGVAVHKLRSAKNLDVVDRMAQDAGISDQKWHKLSAAAKLRLKQISTDEGFAAMARLAADAGLSTEAVARAVQDLNQHRSSTKQVAMVSGLRTVYRDSVQTGGAPRTPTGRAVGAASPRVKYRAWLHSAQTTLPTPASITSRMSAGDKSEYIKLTEAVIRRLEAIKDELKK